MAARWKRTLVLALVAVLVVGVILVATLPRFGKAPTSVEPASTSDEPPSTSLEDVIVTGGVPYERGGPHWNIWFERGNHKKPDFKPVAPLAAGTAYSLFVHLSALAFDDESVITSSVGEAILEHLHESGSPTTNLQLLLLTDPRFFTIAVGSSPIMEMTVDSGRLRALRPDQLTAAPAADPLLDFGSTQFSLFTTGVEGYATLGISIWADGAPIGEISIEVCIYAKHPQSCEDGLLTDGSPGRESMRVANQLSGIGFADAALHFVSLGDAHLMGVFRCNTCDWPPDKYLSWRLKRNEEGLVKFLVETIQPAFQNAVQFDDKQAFEAAGSDLFRTFFYTDTPAAAAAKQAFEAFARDARNAEGAERSVFVRFISHTGDPPLYGVPLSLMRTSVGAGKYEFIGSFVRVITPLELQNYASPPECAGSWIMLAPPADVEDAELRDARASLDEWIDRLRAAKSSAIYEDINAFRRWLEGEMQTSDEPENYEVAPTNAVIAIVSHHEDGALFFDQLSKTPSVNASTIDRHFAPPSVAIINACGAAAPGAVDFMTELNRSGVPAIIGTSTTTDAAMAGDVLSTLLSNIERRQREPDYTLGKALFETTKALQPKYGPKVLIYGMYGNDRVRLCMNLDAEA